LDCPEGELSIVILDDPQIQDLNRRYLDRDRPTNVIAFPMREGDFAGITPELLGDVAVSVDTALREAEAAHIPFSLRFDQLLVHGILHLFGYDHEASDQEARCMEAKSAAILKAIRETA
jgi:probable rRNA maturation factor